MTEDHLSCNVCKWGFLSVKCRYSILCTVFHVLQTLFLVCSFLQGTRELTCSTSTRNDLHFGPFCKTWWSHCSQASTGNQDTLPWLGCTGSLWSLDAHTKPRTHSQLGWSYAAKMGWQLRAVHAALEGTSLEISVLIKHNLQERGDILYILSWGEDSFPSLSMLGAKFIPLDACCENTLSKIYMFHIELLCQGNHCYMNGRSICISNSDCF